MIRPARLEDCAQIALHGAEFHAEAGWADICEYSVDDCQATLGRMCGHPDAILLVAGEHEIVGMAGGLISPLYFNAAHKTGQELFWWISPSARGGLGLQLIDALEGEARARGCQSWAMIALDKISPERTAKLYERRGYRASEHTYVKRL